MRFLCQRKSEPSALVSVLQRKLQVKLCQLISDRTSDRKNRAQNMFLSAFGCICLRYKYVAHTDDQQSANIAEVLEARSKLLCRRLNEQYDFGHWMSS